MLVSTFTLGDVYLGINIRMVREINRSAECTPVPGSPDYIRGMLNIRGRVITLFDIRTRLGWSKQDSGINRSKQYNVIMKTRDEISKIDSKLALTQCPWEDPVGLIVDQLGDVLDIPDDNILPPPANLTSVSVDFIQGVVTFEKNLLVVLDIATVLGLNTPSSG
ncbi:MAG: purine-binding chemotaxis protein CheW [Magnetococcales bacterium]|nr:purine-binding chemotaxis protein CheW [Magnetococcales bacterium]NGZ06614.1 purine-binding chemotaxis protein CheW [Magnetococcales bacterium]